jgi:hypothetical protein
VTLYWSILPWLMRPPPSTLAFECSSLPPLHLDHNLDLISCYEVSSMQALLSMHVIAWITILWPLRKTRNYYLPCLHLWYVLQRLLLHHSLRLPNSLKILTLWRLFQPRARRNVPVSKFVFLVIKFCGIHLFMNFQFLTWYLYVKRLEHIEPTSPPPFLLSTGFLSKPQKVLWTTNVCKATSYSICSPPYCRSYILNQVFRSSSPWVDGCWGFWVW